MLTLVVLAVASLSAALGCDTDALTACAPATVTQWVDNNLAGPIHPMNETDLDQLCSDYDTFVLCIESHLTGCPEDTFEARYAKAMRDSVGGVCDNKPASLTIMTTCLSKENVQYQLSVCAGQLHQAIDGANTDELTCKAMQDYMGCAVARYFYLCGMTEMMWSMKIFDAYYIPLGDYFECDLLAKRLSKVHLTTSTLLRMLIRHRK